MSRALTISACLGLFLLHLCACGPKPMKPDSPLDRAEYHYQRGMTELEADRLEQASDEFNRGKALKPDFPGSYAGLALVLAQRGKFDKASDELSKAGKHGKRFAPVYTAKGRIIMIRAVAEERKPSKWLKDALKEFEKAIKYSKADPSEPRFYRAEAYVLAQEFRLAEDDLKAIITLNRGDYVTRANRRLEVIQQLQRAAPGTIIGLKIAQVEAITRGEQAVLLMEELKLEEVVKKRRPEKFDLRFSDPEASTTSTQRGAPEDIEGHWARNWIEPLLRLDIPGFEVGPEGLFDPDRPLTRADYAKINSGILMLITADSQLENRYIGEESNFPDVRSDFWAYGAIRLCVERGIMSAEKFTGAFRPQNPVSGIEALEIIRDLQNALRQEFD